jgi:MFS family permease
MNARLAPSQPTVYDPRRWLALSVLLLAAMMDLVDVSIVNIALPTIRDDLEASAAALEWTIAGYTLAFALGLITGGRLGDVRAQAHVPSRGRRLHRRLPALRPGLEQ